MEKIPIRIPFVVAKSRLLVRQLVFLPGVGCKQYLTHNSANRQGKDGRRRGNR